GRLLFGLALLLLGFSLAWLERGVLGGFPLLSLLAACAVVFWVFLAARAGGLREWLRNRFQQASVPPWGDAALRGVVLVPAAVLPALLLFLFPALTRPGWPSGGAPGAGSSLVRLVAVALVWAALLGLAWWLG